MPEPSRYDAAFDAAVMAAPIVDMIGDSRMEYDGPRCVVDDCDTPVDNDGEMCEECGDQPHEFRQEPFLRPDWCACGRIRSIGGYSPVHADESPEMVTVPRDLLRRIRTDLLLAYTASGPGWRDRTIADLLRKDRDELLPYVPYRFTTEES